MAILISCRKHPSYMAKRRPTSNCKTCAALWEALLSIQDTAKDWRFSYRLRLTEKRP